MIGEKRSLMKLGLTNKRYVVYMFVLRYPDLEDRVFNRVISDISVVLGETTLTISDSVETGSPVESEIVRVVSLRTAELTEITRFKNPIIRVEVPYGYVSDRTQGP